MMRTFKELQLSSVLDASLKALQFKELTPFQAQVIPMAITGRDIQGLVNASGIGRTAAFALPVVARILKNPRKMALVLAATKELATQDIEMIQKLIGDSDDVQAVCAINGMDMSTQIRALIKRPRIVVATPDRLVELLKKGAVSLSSAEILVLDGLDAMIEKGFSQQLQHIFRFLPRARQTMIFGGELVGEAKTIAAKSLKDPIKAEIAGSSASVAAPAAAASAPAAPAKKSSSIPSGKLGEAPVLSTGKSAARSKSSATKSVDPKDRVLEPPKPKAGVVSSQRLISPASYGVKANARPEAVVTGTSLLVATETLRRPNQKVTSTKR